MKEELRKATEAFYLIYKTDKSLHGELGELEELAKIIIDLALAEIEEKDKTHLQQVGLTRAYHEKWDEMTDKYLNAKERIIQLEDIIKRTKEGFDELINNYTVSHRDICTKGSIIQGYFINTVHIKKKLNILSEAEGGGK